MLTLLHDARVLAPRERGRCDLLLGGGQILAVEPRLSLTGDAIDPVTLDGAWVVPGLVDPHVHVTGGGGEAGFGSRIPPVGATELIAAGTTTVVGVLGTDGTTRTPMDLLATCRTLREHGLTALMWTGSYEVPPPTITGSVRRDLVVVPEVIGVGETAISDHRSAQPSVHELLRLASDCRVAGMLAGKNAKLHLHVGDAAPGLQLVGDAVDSGDLPIETFYPTHVNRNRRLWREALAFMDRGLPVDVTVTEGGDDEVAAADAVEAWLRSDAFPSGLTVSSDAGGSLPRFDAGDRLSSWVSARPGGQLGLLRELAQRGVPLEHALIPMTSGPARLLGLHGKGRVEPGADADLLILSEGLELLGVIARGRVLWASDGWQGRLAA